MIKAIIQFIEKRPFLGGVSTGGIILGIILTITYDFYRDWREAAKPNVHLSDVRISSEMNHYFLRDDDLIPTSIELTKYLNDDIRVSFMPPSKLMTYGKYYDYLTTSRNNVLIFNEEKTYFLNSLKDLLSILKAEHTSEKDKKDFFDILWGNSTRILVAVNFLLDTKRVTLYDFQSSPSPIESDDKHDDDYEYVFEEITQSPNVTNEMCRLWKSKGSARYFFSERRGSWDNYRWESLKNFYKVVKSFDKETLIEIFEKILELYENKLLPRSLKKIEKELDYISRWEVDCIVSNEGDDPFAVLPYANLFVETKKPTEHFKNCKIPLEFRQGYKLLRTYLVGGKSSCRLTFLSKERIGADKENIKWYDEFKNRTSRCRLELYIADKREPINSEFIAFESKSSATLKQTGSSN